MKLQEFCSSGQKRHAFLLTYGIQPAFFEAVALQALIDGGADRVVVLADETEVSNTINAWPPPREVGRRWVLGKSAVTGLFHPKLIARIGRDDALVAILSGNLTSGGWGRNLEVGSAWNIGPMHEDKGSWLASLLKTAQEWTRSPAARQLLREMAEATWLSENEFQSGASRNVVFSTGTNRLFDRLKNRWQGRQFNHARIMTGSTDENGALLLELHKEFGIDSAEVFVTKDRCSFIDKKLRALPLTVKLRAADSPQVLHAKVIHLSGKGGHVCAWGSANCSAAAWLVAPANGANIEIVVLDDAPDISVLDNLFDRFSDGKEFSGLNQAPAKKPQSSGPAPIRVHGVVYDSRRRTFLFELDVFEGIRNLAAIVQANNIKTRMSLEDEGNGSYFAELNTTEPFDQMLSGLIEGQIGEDIVCSDPFWIDQSFELAKRASEKDVYRQFKKVNSSVNNGPERLQILSDLLSIAEEVMNDSSGIHLGARPKRDSDKESPALPLDPSKLVSMIALVPRNWNNTGSTSPGTSSPSLSIFERLFFDPPEHDEPTIRISDPDTEDYEDRSDAPRPPPQNPPPPPHDEPSQAAVDLESRVKIQGQLTVYLNRLRSPNFARDFHPQRLSDVIFVIIAIAYRAWRGGWLPGQASGSIAAKLANTLLFETISGHRGLLQAYKSQLSPELLVEYKATLGHGRIWAALLAVLAIEPTSSESSSVLRGSALSQVYKARELIAAADPTSLSGLFDRSIAGDLIAKALGVAPNVDKSMIALTEYIAGKSQELLGMQEKYVERTQLFWSRWDGWHYPRQTGVGSVGTAVSLKFAMENDELVRQFVHAVTEAWLVPANPDILAASDISNKPRQ